MHFAPQWQRLSLCKLQWSLTWWQDVDRMLLHRMLGLTVIVIIVGEQIHFALSRSAAVRTTHAVTGQFILVSPEETGERDVDERSSPTCLEHVDPDWLFDACVVLDLPHAGQVRHVGNSDVGLVGVSRTLGLVKEVEFPGNIIVSSINVSAST